MNWLITGIIGAGKTLNTVKFLREDASYRTRTVYYHNIKEVVFDDWIELSDEDAKNWHTLPTGSIVLFDEAQGLFPTCKPSSNAEVPLHISKLNTSRHSGYDLFFITQHPALLDVRLRRLCAPHVHYDRAFGSKLVTRFTFKKCAIDPDDYHAKKESDRTSLRLDKKYYGTYKSTELDTHQFRPPKKLAMVVLGAIGVIGYAIYFSMTLGKDPQVATDLTQEQTQTANNTRYQNAAQDTEFTTVYPKDPLKFAELYKPRIQGLAHTAPIYDQLNVPVSMPKTLCVRIMKNGKKDCKCYTQQASKLIVDANTCNSMIDSRFFDHTIPDAVNTPVVLTSSTPIDQDAKF